MFELGKNHKVPDELMFENKYGKIVDYSLFGDGYLVIGFSEGYVAHISTHKKEISNLTIFIYRGWSLKWKIIKKCRCYMYKWCFI